jgi:hypothetical protein
MASRSHRIRPLRAALALVCLTAAQSCSAADEPSPLPGNAAVALLPATRDYAAVLAAHVNERGLVDYRALNAARAPLDRYVLSLSALDPNADAAWGDEQKIAFWINAYNALTLETIVDHYPIEKGGLVSGLRFPKNSIRQIPGVWDKLTHTVMGRTLTLDRIEHEILRKQFKEPRIHMALVCAAMGCPPLRNEPYAADRLNEQLEDRSRRFLASPERFRIDRDARALYLSSIFEWFGEDFGVVYKTADFAHQAGPVRPVLAFVAMHLDPADAGDLNQTEWTIRYLDYDWTLNDQAVVRGAGSE